MRAVLQKVRRSWVEVDSQIIGEIGEGFLVLLGVHRDDAVDDVEWMIKKILTLRLFSDNESESFMEKSIVEHGGGVLVVSQFTLFADCRKGTRPSFSDAAPSEKARELYVHFLDKMKQTGIHVETGEFGEHMDVEILNNGPITLILDSREK